MTAIRTVSQHGHSGRSRQCCAPTKVRFRVAGSAPLRIVGAVAYLPLVLLGACSSKPDPDLFPLESGRSWTYQVTSEWENQTREVNTLTLRNEGRDGQLASGAAWRRRSSDGAAYWLRAEPTGIVRVAAQTELDSGPRPDTPARTVLPLPATLGSQWQTTTTAYLLRRRNEFPPEIRHSHPALPMRYQVDAADVPVDTGAGHFDHCLRVKGQAGVKLFADPVTGWQTLPLTTTEWYCPGMGLVRLERAEPANSSFLIGGRLVMDLVTWE